MSDKVSIDKLADEIISGLTEYATLSTESMKAAVKKAGATVKDEINSSAPVLSGRYAKSWQSKTTAETVNTLEVTVYSPSRYMLAHLLENGHAKRGGGRVAAIPHIAPAQEQGETELMQMIERSL